MQSKLKNLPGLPPHSSQKILTLLSCNYRSFKRQRDSRLFPKIFSHFWNNWVENAPKSVPHNIIWLKTGSSGHHMDTINPLLLSHRSASTQWWKCLELNISKTDRLVGEDHCEIRELPNSPLGFTSVLLALLLPLLLGPLPVLILHLVLPFASCLPTPTRLNDANIFVHVCSDP